MLNSIANVGKPASFMYKYPSKLFPFTTYFSLSQAWQWKGNIFITILFNSIYIAEIEESNSPKITGSKNFSPRQCISKLDFDKILKTDCIPIGEN